MKTVNKGEYGYLKYRKKMQIIKSLIGLVIVFAILFGGLIACGTKNNICTVIAAVMSLPTAKFMVTLFIVIGYKQPDEELLHKLKAVNNKNIILSDCVMSAKDKITFVPFAIITDTCIYCYSPNTKLSEEYFEKGVEDFIKSCGDVCKVKLIKDWEMFVKRAGELNNLEVKEKKCERLKEAFLILVI